jgi:hypothetical protein
MLRKRYVQQYKSGSNIAKHAWTQDHKINFDECKIIDKATYRNRATLESWHTATTLNRPFQGLFRHIAGGAKHWGERAAKPWLPYILLMSER